MLVYLEAGLFEQFAGLTRKQFSAFDERMVGGKRMVAVIRLVSIEWNDSIMGHFINADFGTQK